MADRKIMQCESQLPLLFPGTFGGVGRQRCTLERMQTLAAGGPVPGGCRGGGEGGGGDLVGGGRALAPTPVGCVPQSKLLDPSNWGSSSCELEVTIPTSQTVWKEHVEY